MINEQKLIEKLKELIALQRKEIAEPEIIGEEDFLIAVRKINKEIASLEKEIEQKPKSTIGRPDYFDQKIKEQVPNKTAEEILKDNLSDYYWALIENQTTLPDHEKTLKKWIIEAMQSYHEAKLKEITDSDIEAWAAGADELSEFEMSLLVTGAKAFRDGEIKHIDNE